MAVRAIPFEGQDANEEDYYLLHRECGVMSGLNLTMSGLNWTLSTGEVYASGTQVIVEDAPLTGASVPTATANPRRDMLVARRTLLPGGGSFGEIALKQGAPAGSPVDPAPTQDMLTVFEEPLWSWQVAASGVATTSSIRDLRQNAVWRRSGPVANTIYPIPALAGWTARNWRVHLDGVNNRRFISGYVTPNNTFNPTSGTHRLGNVPSGARPTILANDVAPPFFRIPIASGSGTLAVDVDIEAGGDIVIKRGPNQLIQAGTLFSFHGVNFL